MANLITRQAERYFSDDIVQQLGAEQAVEVAHLRGQGIVPRLGVILVEGKGGEVDAPSANYVDRKVAHGRQIGAESTVARCGRWVVSEVLHAWNEDAGMHGAMLQLPFPRYDGESAQLLQERTVRRLAQITPTKDVDGLRPENPGFPAATPAAVMRLLRQQSRIPLKDLPVVLVIGSEGYLIGRHMEPLLAAVGIVPMCHDKALYPVEQSPAQLEAALRVKLARANIVVSCAGVPGLIQPDMLHDDMVIIDAGVRMVDGRLRGDLDPSIADSPLDILYTGPTRGVGPLTVCELFENVILSARHHMDQ